MGVQGGVDVALNRMGVPGRAHGVCLWEVWVGHGLCGRIVVVWNNVRRG